MREAARRLRGDGRASLAPPSADLVRLPGEQTVRRLDNGLTVSILRNPQAPLVTTALWYRAGTRDDPPGHGGVAHFLEHMMFKGSPRYGQGEIDRRTQALGGSNNAFTSHDATAYHFNFARDRWSEALAIEADRMAALCLEPADIDSERQVIVEEIAMYESEPWDSLEIRAVRLLFGEHPYGCPVLGTRDELLATGRDELARFHQAYYRPDNAVLVVAGDVDGGALERVAEAFAAIPAGAEPRPPMPPVSFPRERLRLERRKGEVPRWFLALPAPAADNPDHAVLKLVCALLGGGRTSRLYRDLVDERQLCAWVSVDLGDSALAGSLAVSAELVPGAEPSRVEGEVVDRLAALADGPPGDEELERAKKVVLADWVFAHERVHQQALAAGFALTLFDRGHLERELERILAATASDVSRLARRYLGPEVGGVTAWSLPEGAR